MDNMKELTDEQRKALGAHYDSLLKRITTEYDLRDRDFLIYVSLSGGLFAALGFVLQAFRPHIPTAWIILGLAILILGLVGHIVAKSLLGSVQSFTFWQTLMNANLTRLELAILPDAKYGNWCHIVASDPCSKQHLDKQELEQLKTISVSKKRRPKDTALHREKLAKTLVCVWRLGMVAGCIFIVVGVVGLACPSEFQCAIGRLWPKSP